MFLKKAKMTTDRARVIQDSVAKQERLSEDIRFSIPANRKTVKKGRKK